MSIYKKYCNETLDNNGQLIDFEIKCPVDFNFSYDVIDVLAAEEPDRKAVTWCNMDGEVKNLSFRDISVLSNKAAHVLMNHGICGGDRVMVVLKRHLEYWYIIPALHKIGAVAVPVTHMLTADDFKYRFEYGEIKAVISAPEIELNKKISEACGQSRIKPLLFSIAPVNESIINITKEMESVSEELKRCRTRLEDPILMYFTSGTTGYPKAVMHDNSYPLSHIITAKYWQQVEDGGLHFTVAETGWAKAAWGKMYGQWLCGSAVMVYDFDNFDPKQLTIIVNKFSVTSFCAPPTVYRYLVKKGMYDMPSLKHASTAGEALSPEVFHLFREKTGLELMEGFGQTESTLILANFKGRESRPGSLGQPSCLYHVELLKPDGSYAAVGELGEIVIVPPKSGQQYGIFSAYYKDEVLYKHVWRNGLYHTGDLAWRDEDNYYWFHGRIDDVIKSGGYRIGPYEIENVLNKHKAVLECSVVGIEDLLRGQAIKAFIVPAQGYTANNDLKKQLKEFCNSQLAEYKWIRLIEFVTELPKTISGKIRKNVLRNGGK